jgi:hypothetical protein
MGRMDLADKIVALFRSGLFVQFSCNPSTVVIGSDQNIEIDAIIFLDPSVPRPSFEPAATCSEPRRIRVKLTEEASSQPAKRVFRGVIKSSELVPGIYNFALEPHPAEPPIASTSLLVLDKSFIREVETLSRILN